MTGYQLKGSFPLIFERGAPGRRGYRLPPLDVPEQPIEALIPDRHQRTNPPALPEVSEPEAVRHFVGLSRRNYGVDVGFYPLGSCTMKYNPKINEEVAALPGFARLHPYQPEETVQGALELMYNLERYLCEIAGLSRATLQPAAGAHGELLGLMIMRAYHESRGEGHTRREVLVPDSAHGTNPASAAMCGYRVVEVQSNARGGVDVAALRALVGPKTAGLMLTNPNTLGLFEEDILEIARLVHDAGGLLYYDGANANAILGICRPGDMGFDIVHFNLHKTFSTPHGGGGPGSGPIAVREELVPFLPVPTVERDGDRYYLDFDRPQSVGRIKGFYGNFGMMVRAYAYIRTMGAAGLKAASEQAVINANYLMKRLAPLFDVAVDRYCKHEFVLSGRRYKRLGVRTLDIAKRLLDYGIHAPTVYFPLIVEEALMIEPTETETKETLDEFARVMEQIVREIEEDPDLVRNAPHETPVRRLDEARAARQPDLCFCAPASSTVGEVNAGGGGRTDG
ncbi:MAG: aminomethyl-transferring glycine dehydrogenase subunit GcvPB [Firmicutes bacterium]|nr:aminomethyl-transferring glycine dehydrogenase subunit GcvPB [Bacillota bacterium]